MKRGPLTAWTLSIVSIMLLSVGLIGIDLRPGRSAQLAPLPPMPGAPDAGSGSGYFLVALRIGLLLLIALFLVSVVVNLFTPAGRKRLLAMAAAMLVAVLALTLLSFVHLPQKTAEPQEAPAMGAGQPLPGGSPAGSTIPFEPRPPGWLLWVALAATSLLAAAGVTGVVLLVLRHRPNAARQRLAEQSQAAIDSILSGADIRNVVIHCYREMSLVVRDELGIERETAVTPREFVLVLERWGLPSRPVRDLTEVFEEIRYGNAAAAADRERRALDSLSLIVGFCAATVPRGIHAATEREDAFGANAVPRGSRREPR